MRYYVLLPSSREDDLPYIVAETASDEGDQGEAGADRTLTLAGGIGGAAARIVTEEELLSDPDGRRVLAAWNASNDDAYHADARRIEPAPRPRGRLSLVRNVPEGSPE